MIIDILVLVTVVLAFIKGYTKGLIMALFNAVSLVIALALAIKFSTVISPYVSEKTDSGHYAPILSFGLIFLAATFVIRLAGKAIEKTFETVKVGFVNRIGGVALYLLVQLAVLSVILYYLGQMEFFSDKLLTGSVTYPIIAPWGPAVINGIGYLIPWFQDMFQDLDNFFDQVPVPDNQSS